MNGNLDQTLQQFTKEVTEIYGDSLLSVVLYGSAAAGEFVQGQSNINCLLLLRQVTPQELRKCTGYIQRWRDVGIGIPLFFDPAYIRSSKDVFPIEFLDMKDRYKVLYGQDFLRDADPNPEHLRFQCEQELKGKLLRLRQQYIQRSQSSKDLITLMAKSSSSFIIIFRGLLHLKALPAARSADDVLVQLSRLGLPVKAITHVHNLKYHKVKLGSGELDALFDQYLTEIQTAVDFVDTLDLEGLR